MASQHSSNFNLDIAIKLALLHDTLEDTSAKSEEIAKQLGADVANGISALTKSESLPKAEKMMDSLRRIRDLQTEVWAVKMADRITNLQEPPAHWENSKRSEYRQEAIQILHYLKGGNSYLEQRLSSKIASYEKYIRLT